MGMYLTRPVILKAMGYKSSTRTKLRYSSCEMQGWRRFMEDASVCEQQLPDGNAIFAVFDGHGGPQVSQFLKRHFVNIFTAQQDYRQRKYIDAFMKAFEIMDQKIGSGEGECELEIISKEVQPQANLKYGAKSHRSLPNLRSQQSERCGDSDRQGGRLGHKISHRAGSTANIVLITEERFVIANCGDSRSVLQRGKETIELSCDHKPRNPVELKRITRAGARVVGGRINEGGLNLSRSFGDFAYKSLTNLPADQQMIVSTPDLKIVDRSSLDKFILIGCDGIFEKKAHSFINTIHKDLLRNRKGPEILSSLFDRLIAKDTREVYGCDNMSAILVEFL